jgi:fructokinase
MQKPHLILGIGELLWDMPPVHSDASPSNEPSRQGALVGAPANFSVMAGRLGNHAVVLSRIGRDELGRKAIDRLEPMPIDTSALQIDPAQQTGRVTVEYKHGEPHYTIHQPAGWDFLELTDEWVQLAGRADAICFGSLAQRGENSRQTIQTLAAETTSSCIRVFDVNLRPPFYTSEIIQESLEFATLAKMNEAEAPIILNLLGLAGAEAPMEGTLALRFAAERLLDEFPGIQMVAITRGGRGSLLVTRDEWNERPGIPIEPGDAIGAGDAFTAAITHYLLRGAGLATLNEAGNRWGSWVASQVGAMPELTDSVREGIALEIEGAV